MKKLTILTLTLIVLCLFSFSAVSADSQDWFTLEQTGDILTFTFYEFEDNSGQVIGTIEIFKNCGMYEYSVSSVNLEYFASEIMIVLAYGDWSMVFPEGLPQGLTSDYVNIINAFNLTGCNVFLPFITN